MGRPRGLGVGEYISKDKLYGGAISLARRLSYPSINWTFLHQIIDFSELRIFVRVKSQAA